jgi:hypothetical protein
MESSFEGFEQTSSKVTNYVLAFWILPKYIGKDMEPTNSILPPPPKVVQRLHCFFQLLSVKPHLVEGQE